MFANFSLSFPPVKVELHRNMQNGHTKKCTLEFAIMPSSSNMQEKGHIPFNFFFALFSFYQATIALEYAEWTYTKMQEAGIGNFFPESQIWRSNFIVRPNLSTFLQTYRAIFPLQGYNCVGICRKSIRKNIRYWNLEFLPPRQNMEGKNSQFWLLKFLALSNSAYSYAIAAW